MARAQFQKSRSRLDKPQEPLEVNPDDLSETFDGYSSAESREKDATELELEKLVFGDELGFYNGLKSPNHVNIPGATGKAEKKGEDDEYEGIEDGLEDVDDADLFFLDTNPSAIVSSTTSHPIAQNSNDPGDDDVEDHAVWVDSDDERIVVSLASNPRLRKLRVAESEDLITGKEYTKRLRRQFERLYPVPDWANPSASERDVTKKKRRSSNKEDSSEDASADDMSVDSDDLSVQPLAALLQNTNEFLRVPSSSSTRRKLRPEIINIQRTKDVGLAQPSAITSLTFHPLHPLLLSSGPASTLFLHHISPHPPNPNPLLTSLHLRSTPLATSTFLQTNGSKIFFSGRRRYFHMWDLSSGDISKVSTVAGHHDEQRSMESFKLSPCGRWMGLKGSGRKGGGVINVLNAETCQWVAEVRVEGNGGVADFDWWGDGDGMVVLGKGGEAVEWDGRRHHVVARWLDEGAVGTTIVALGGRGGGDKRLGGDRWIAVGSSSGIVNVYDRKAWCNASGSSAAATQTERIADTDIDVNIPPRPKPARALDHLTTPISSLAFSPDGQILAMASRWKRDALRLVHLPTLTVFRNWPTSSTPLGRITAIAFAPSMGIAAEGAEKGAGAGGGGVIRERGKIARGGGVGGDISEIELLAIANEQGKIRLWEIRY